MYKPALWSAKAESEGLQQKFSSGAIIPLGHIPSFLVIRFCSNDDIYCRVAKDKKWNM